MSDALRLFEGSEGRALLEAVMKYQEKRKYVEKYHTRTITQMKSGAKAGRWKTWVGTGKERKEVSAGSEEDLYEKLYKHYLGQNLQDITYGQAFSEWIEHIKTTRNLEDKTIETYKSVYMRFTPETIQKTRLRDITDETLTDWLGTETERIKPKPDALKKLWQQVAAVFRFSMQRKYIEQNPTLYVDPSIFRKNADRTTKTDEEKEFSEEEVLRIRKEARKEKSPRALMILLASHTGMRVAELPALHWEDIEDGWIHIHRQIVYGATRGEVREKDYTKDERASPKGGRRFPITEEIREVLEMAKKLPGESDYVFHGKHGEIIKPDGYHQHLRRLCHKLGIKTTNNHAFRMMVSAQLRADGFTSEELSLLLGHSVETNERRYSRRDRRKLDAIEEKMRKIKKKEDTVKASS